MQGTTRRGRKQYNSGSMNRRGYNFLDEDVEEMYDELLKHGKILALVSRRPKEVGMIRHLQFCHYHQFISHLTPDCITLKNQLQEFLDKKILVIKEE